MRAPNLPKTSPSVTRRGLLKTSGGALALAGAGWPGRLLAQDPISVAAIYTVPVEQQWVSRIHKAAETAAARGDITYAFTENTSNTDYERVMREYAEAGSRLIVGEAPRSPRWSPTAPWPCSSRPWRSGSRRGWG
jgi:basic membrane lipoprotein Med (substrate-binding protein (PBP1-ABC) superfamily)